MKTILYDKTISYQNIAPYNSSYFNSIYEGIVIEIYVVNHCNLNCAGCNRFAPIAQPWNISVEEFEKEIILIKSNIPNIKKIVLMGGEPTLHPNLIQLCEVTRKYYPDIDISIVSNGLKISQLNFELFKKFNIEILICNYPQFTDQDFISKKINHYNTHWTTTRMYSTQILIDEKGTQNQENNFFNCYKFPLPNFVVKQSKLFICPIGSNIDIYCQKANINIPLIKNIDYLEIKEIQNDLDKIQTFIFTSKNICRYCISNKTQWMYHKSHRDIIEYRDDLKTLYYNDYFRYEKIVLGDKKFFDTCLSCSNLDDNYHAQIKNKDNIRFGNGLLDIIFYYNDFVPKDSFSNIYQNLKFQSIINQCTIYLIVDRFCKNDNDFINYFWNIKDLNIIILKNYNDIKTYNKYTYYLSYDENFEDKNFLLNKIKELEYDK